MLKILIAEDDIELRHLFSHILTKSGYATMGVSNGKEAIDKLESDYYDIVISDIMMPVMDGYALVRSLRDIGNNIPVLMITAKDAFDDMRLGFISGTDDYMVKPINVNEMLIRVGALLRRAKMISERRQIIGDTILESDTFTVKYNGQKLMLPQKEFMLLYKLLSYPGKIFTRIQLMDEIWGQDSDTGWETVTVHIGRLRKRFEGWDEFSIESVRRLGYKAVKLV
jgi:DNA-binding response OmpR family regulator